MLIRLEKVTNSQKDCEQLEEIQDHCSLSGVKLTKKDHHKSKKCKDYKALKEPSETQNN